ncbi:MAG TPA: MoxR family ATPase [Pirellulaceae bacterium]|nr:MoxR family ATPase [Pirellulaceae bacterium]
MIGTDLKQEKPEQVNRRRNRQDCGRKWGGGLNMTDGAAANVSRDRMHELVTRILDNVTQVVLGKRDVAEQCLVALLSGEHILLEDVPGVGKTLMGKALARSINGIFRRIQFTPDLLPSDIVGSSLYKSNTSEFIFNEGPIFSNFVLADEINRAPPRTQSALLEAMSDRHVSVDGVTHALPVPFMVIATQNPYEFEGTYVLPESQMDRFLMRISMGYPGREFERQILETHREGEPVESLHAVCSAEELSTIQRAVRAVRVESSISEYILDVVHATRDSSELAFGVSTRGGLLWYRASQAWAFLQGRDYVIPDDAKRLAVSVHAHRVQLKGIFQAGMRQEAEEIIQRILAHVTVPV